MQKYEQLVDLEMLQNEYLVAIVTVHTAENEPLKNWCDLFSSLSSLLSRQLRVLAVYAWRCGTWDTAIRSDVPVGNS